jgi:uncharacterized damage-inducible protein DinB
MTAPTTSESTAPMTPATATPADLLFGDLEQELATTRRLLAVVPDGHADYRPHEKSMPLGRLANHLAELPSLATIVASSEEFDFATAHYTPTAHPTTEAILREFDTQADALRAGIRALTWSDVGRRWVMRAGPQIIVDAPKGQVLRTFGLSHMAHHRAQLGVYLRMLGVALPSVYGPTADQS